MKEYTILNYEYDMDYHYQDTQNVYEVSAKGKIISFIIKLLIKHKIIKQYQQRITCQIAKQISVDTESIINDLCEKINMYRYAQNQEIAGIMVGREQFELLRDDYIKSSKTMYGTMAWNDMGCHRVMNVPIALNPFIDGVVFITKDMIKDMVWR